MGTPALTNSDRESKSAIPHHRRRRHRNRYTHDESGGCRDRGRDGSKAKTITEISGASTEEPRGRCGSEGETGRPQALREETITVGH